MELPAKPGVSALGELLRFRAESPAAAPDEPRARAAEAVATTGAADE